ncbi:MAG: M23 family metallopeptidase [Alphaproteobacteria bacterium]
MECKRKDYKKIKKYNKIIRKGYIMRILKIVLDTIAKGFQKIKKLIPSKKISQKVVKKKKKTPRKIRLKIRGVDAYGSGAFGASRKRKDGTRYKHQGIDIISKPNDKIKALTDGKFIRKVDPYGNGKFSGFLIEDKQKNLQKIFYVLPIISIGTKFKKGKIIGIAQDIAGNKNMTNHYHFEVRNKDKKLLNPNQFLEKSYKLA